MAERLNIEEKYIQEIRDTYNIYRENNNLFPSNRLNSFESLKPMKKISVKHPFERRRKMKINLPRKIKQHLKTVQSF
ncbi:MAG: hypothetical protein ACOC35_14720 [Promethearchaeia archaeon]